MFFPPQFVFKTSLHSTTHPTTTVHTSLHTLTLHQTTLRTPQVIGINKDTFHPIIVLKVGMALRAFHLSDFWFENTRTEWAFDVTLWFGSGDHIFTEQESRHLQAKHDQ
jgi:hypothetical protein